jgi:alpha-1,2-mannosyltransferase
VLPWLVLTLGLGLHVWELAGPTWNKVRGVDHGRDFASYYYAVQAAHRDLNPYDTRQLGKLARADATRQSVHPFFYPPTFLLTQVWALPLRLPQAYRVWFWLDSLFLLAALLALWQWLPGPATLVGMGVILASFTPIHDNHWMGQANLPVLAAMLWGLYLAERERPVAGGALLGLACMLKMSPALLVLWWLARRRFVAALSACGAALGLSLLALPLVELGDQLHFYLDVLPGFASGDYNGLAVPILLTGNHSVPNLWAQLFEAGSTLPQGARLGAGLTNLALLGLLGWLLRRQTSDLLGAALAAGAISGVMLLVPVYTYEHHLVQLVFPLLAATAALVHGRLRWGWAAALVPAYIVLAWWWAPMAVLSRQWGGATGWLLQEAKPIALLLVCTACAIAATRPDRVRESDARPTA